jgi:hypothetical protein
MCLQETWLQDGNLHLLDRLCEDYVSISKSGIDCRSDIHSGRVPGGVDIVYKRSLCRIVKEVMFQSRRVRSALVNINSSRIISVLLNLYNSSPFM